MPYGLACLSFLHLVDLAVMFLQAFAERVLQSEQASQEPFSSSIKNFYQTDAITRNSPVMAKCVKARNEMHIDTLATAEFTAA